MKDSPRRWLKTPRVQLTDADSRLGAYPSIKRTGDQDRLGTGPIRFDDRTTVVFTTGTTVNYPTNLVPSDPAWVTTDELLDVVTETSGVFNGGGISAPGNVTRGIADRALDNLPGSILIGDGEESFQPFKEENLYPVEAGALNDPFYLTGSAVTAVGQGFSQPLSAKTKITIPIPASAASTFGYTEFATAASPQPGFSPMVYYNAADKKWEPISTGYIATGFTGSSEVQNYFDRAPIGFSRGMRFMFNAPELACLPISNFGFPMHYRYHATASQQIDISSYINQPFLVEKFVLSMPITYSLGTSDNGIGSDDMIPGSLPGALSDHDASILSFFILNQRTPFSASQVHFTAGESAERADVSTSTLFTRKTQVKIPKSNAVLSEGGPAIDVNTGRDLITFGQVLSYSGTNRDGTTTIDTLIANGLGREVNIDTGAERFAAGVTGASNRGSDFAQRQMVMSGSVKTLQRVQEVFGYSFVDESAAWPASVGTTANPYLATITSSIIPGGRTNIDMGLTGRDLVASVPGGPLGNSSFTDLSKTGNPKTVRGIAQSPMIDSPYLLLPGDQLVLGWQAPLAADPDPAISSSAGDTPLTGTFAQVTIPAGGATLTLYGSLIRDSVEFHETLNQPLYSNAIHEALHFDNPVLDQFDTEPRANLSGTYVDDYVTGSLELNRGVVGSNVTGIPGTATSTSLLLSERLVTASQLTSLTRNPRHVTVGERYFDTLLPRPDEFIPIGGGYVASASVGVAQSVVTEETAYFAFDLGASSNGIADNLWHKSYPFEPIYSGLNRNLDPLAGVVVDRDTNGSAVSAREARKFIVIRTYGTSGGSINDVFMADYRVDFPSAGNFRLTTPSNDDVIRDIYGIGDDRCLGGGLGWHNMPSAKRLTGAAELTADTDVSAVGIQIRGWKHGVYSGFPTNTTAVFRRDRYGQFRDMLEQRLDSRFYDTVGSLGPAGGNAPGPRSPAVVCRFVDFEGADTKPNTTYSSNQSLHATSSVPYFDGVVKNRADEPIDINLLNSNLLNVV